MLYRPLRGLDLGDALIYVREKPTALGGCVEQLCRPFRGLDLGAPTISVMWVLRRMD